MGRVRAEAVDVGMVVLVDGVRRTVSAVTSYPGRDTALGPRDGITVVGFEGGGSWNFGSRYWLRTPEEDQS
jgi:hypothetical protein